MRGGEIELPKVTVLSEEELQQRLEADSQSSEEDEQSFSRWSRGLALFGLAPAEYTSSDARQDYVSEIAAVYFFREKDIVVVDRGEPLDSPEMVEIFAHEVVHALQDAEYDLERYQENWGHSFDAWLAIDALIEGEATLYQLLVNIRLRGFAAREVAWRAFFQRWQSDMLREAEEDPAPVSMASVQFPYAFGGGYVLQHWLARGRAGVDVLFERPPLTTREVLFGPADLDLADEAAALEERAVPALDGEYEEPLTIRFGAWITRVFAGKQGLPLFERLDAAERLVADVFSVHYDPTADQVLSAWRVRSDTEQIPPTWPGLRGSFFATLRETQYPEAILLAAEGAAPDLHSLAWQPDTGTDQEEQASAGLRSTLRPFPRGALACRLHHPTLWSERAASLR